MNSHPTRRHILQQFALLAGVAHSAKAELAVTKRTGGPALKTSLNAYSFSNHLNRHAKGEEGGMSLLQVCDFAAQQQFDAVDLTGYFFTGYPQVPADKDIYEVKRRAFDLGLDISGTGVRNNFTTADKVVRDESVKHIKEWVEVAAKLGAPVLRVFADTQMKAQTWEIISNNAQRDDVEAWIAEAIRECADHAAKFGVIIGVQNHGDFLKTGEQHISLLKRIDSPWCGAIVDTGYYKTDDPYADMAMVTPYAANWQIKESPFGSGSPVRTDLIKLLTIIRMAGWRGYIPIETLSSSGREYDPFALVPAFLAELKAALKATESIAPASKEEPFRLPPASDSGKSPGKAGRKPANKKKPTAP